MYSEEKKREEKKKHELSFYIEKKKSKKKKKKKQKIYKCTLIQLKVQYAMSLLLPLPTATSRHSIDEEKKELFLEN